MKILIYLIVCLLAFNSLSSQVSNAFIKSESNPKALNDRVIVRVKQGYDILNKDYIFRNDDIVRAEYLLNPISSITYNKKLLNKNTNRLQATQIYYAEEKLLRTFIVYFDSKLSPDEFCKKLALSNPAIEIAEPYYIPELLSYVPNDEFLFLQDEYLKLISAYEAWEIEKGNPNVTIGISDSGVNQYHEDISGSLAINDGEIPDDGIDNDENGYIDDYTGYNFSWKNTSQYPNDTYNSSIQHGQQVAGIAAASTNNERGVAGIGFNSTIFPLKIIEGNALKYAYESIVYAAVRGFKVLNCSWGSVKPFSEIDQSIIDYAVSRDVAIVAAAGNTTNSINKYEPFYPASYYGVLGVGEVSSYDDLANTSSISIGCRILAPGNDNYTTTNNGYQPADGGTSFASPVVAGAVALVRSRFPELSAIQALEFTRQAVDFTEVSQKDKELIPGRINLYKAVSTEPFSIPGILPSDYIYSNENNEVTDRFKEGDIVNLNIIAKNVLGAASNLTFKLSVAYDPNNSVSILKDTYTIAQLNAGADLNINGFQLKINQNNKGNIFLRVDISDNNEYKDFFKFIFVPTRSISTFSNSQLRFSMSDIGEFGYDTDVKNPAGVGFVYKDFGNQIYRNSSVMFSYDNSIAIYNSYLDDYYMFSPVKNFVNPDKNTAIYNDDNSGSDAVGLEVNQTISFPSENSKAVRFDFKLTNNGAKNIKNGSFGIYIDWDISENSDNNRSKLLPSATPEENWNINAIAQAVYSNDEYPYFGSAIISKESKVKPQAAAFTNYADNYFRVETLNSDINIQSLKEVGDFSTVVGMKFLGDWAPEETKECAICIGAGDTEEELALSLKNCLLKIVSVNNSTQNNVNVNVYPNPTYNLVKIKSLSEIYNLEYSLVDILGNSVSKTMKIDFLNNGEEIGLDLSNLNSGIYFLKIVENGNIKVLKIVKL